MIPSIHTGRFGDLRWDNTSLSCLMDKISVALSEQTPVSVTITSEPGRKILRNRESGGLSKAIMPKALYWGIATCMNCFLYDNTVALSSVLLQSLRSSSSKSETLLVATVMGFKPGPSAESESKDIFLSLFFVLLFGILSTIACVSLKEVPRSSALK